MKRLAASMLLVGVLAATTEATARQEGSGPVERPSVSAPVLEGITIDGDLSDWPDSMTIHSLDKLFHYDGRRQNYEDLESTDLVEPEDLSAAFAVGYDPGEQLLYVAVIVRDDTLVVGNRSHMDTDAVELYVDGLRSDARFTKPIRNGQSLGEAYDLSEIPVQQYIALPGPGPVYGIDTGTHMLLVAGDLEKTRTTSAVRREGDVTTYEWAVQVFDQYPDRPTRLEPGKRIGFDIAVADEDMEDGEVGPDGATQMNRLDWIYWGPQWAGMKVTNAGILGELVLEE